MAEKIQIEAIHYHLSDSTKTFIRGELSKLSYLDNYIVDGILRVVREKHSYRVTIDLHFNFGKRIHLHTDNNKLYSAIEDLMHIAKNCAEEKKKLKDYHKHHSHNTRHTENNIVE